VAARLAGEIDIRFPGAARNRDDIERHVRGFEADDCEGIVVVNLTYGPALRMVNAFRDVRLPVMLANIQPEPAVTAGWDMSNLTYNQGVHGAQDTANSLMRLGVRFKVVTDDWRADSFAKSVSDFACAARAVKRMRKAASPSSARCPAWATS
jgi:L-arabinose isomerase